ncbi:hypothetical protein QN277_004733 [Acacia crassicarpa]|uniref:Gnk2-homologous domain-containing protein n=1 Tax=Acacia crassicarpa TaxID=499986 RepID=A0AAE1J501_9FABA|nr:hypothetical protein QN277_004733 [Acacia crassicarpa]
MSIFSSLVLLLPLPLPLLLLTSFITPSSSTSEVAFIYYGCSQAKFTPGSAYESGVKSILTSIVNAAMLSSYNNLTVLTSSSSPSSSQDIPIYGLFQCRGDFTAADCSHCVAQAVSQLGTICPDSTNGSLQLNGCFVRYDDSQFLGGEDNTLVLRKCGLPDGFNSDVLTWRDAVLAYLETSDRVYQMFRTISSGNLQGMAQCLGDLSASECQDCLSNAIGQLRVECGPVQWGQIYLAKCYARYSVGGDDSSDGNSEGGDDSPDGNSDGGDDSPDGNSEDEDDSPDRKGKHKNKNKKKKKKNKLLKKIAKIVGPTAATMVGGGGTALLTIYITKFFKKRKERKEEDEPPSPSTKDPNGFKVIVPGPIVVRVVDGGGSSPGPKKGGNGDQHGGGLSSGPKKGGNGDQHGGGSSPQPKKGGNGDQHGGGSSPGPKNGDQDDVPDFPVPLDFRFPWDCPFPCDWHCSRFH